MLPVDEQDRMIASLVPEALDGAERDVIKTAYAMAHLLALIAAVAGFPDVRNRVGGLPGRPINESAVQELTSVR
jgi:hypothetical protein